MKIANNSKELNYPQISFISCKFEYSLTANIFYNISI